MSSNVDSSIKAERSFNKTKPPKSTPSESGEFEMQRGIVKELLAIFFASIQFLQRSPDHSSCLSFKAPLSLSQPSAICTGVGESSAS
jgi:hypothetical protein